MGKFITLFVVCTGIAFMVVDDFYIAMLLGLFGSLALCLFTMESIESKQLREIKELRNDLREAINAK